MSRASGIAIVAEAAQGFEGDARQARLLVRAARAGEADAVKFQLVIADELATPAYAYYDLFKSLEMSDAAWAAVAEEARSAGVSLIFDVFGERSLDLAIRLGAAGVKLHSTDFFNQRLIDAAVARAPEIYLSIGGIEYDDVTALLDARAAAAPRLTVMFGFQGEPTAIEQNHLARLPALRARFPSVRFGFMDHADGASDEAGWLGVLAVAYGARVIEKHVTLDRALQLEDFVSALAPVDFARYAARIRAAERALGSAALELTEIEREYGRRAVKVVVAARPLPAGAVLQDEDLAALRAPIPDGRTVMRQVSSVAGRRLRRPIDAGQPICAEDLQ